MIYLRLCLPVSRPKPNQTMATANKTKKKIDSCIRIKEGIYKNLEAIEKAKNSFQFCDVKQDNDMNYLGSKYLVVELG